MNGPHESDLDARIAAFRERALWDREFCEQLFREATIRLLAHKYAYYVLDNPFVEDRTYDLEERSWYVMGRALGHLTKEETSPCVGFDRSHPLAAEGIALAHTLIK